MVAAAGHERLDFRNRGFGFQSRGEDLRRFTRPRERARQHEVDDHVHLGEAGNRFGELLRTGRRQRAEGIVGVFRSALRGNSVTNQIQLDGSGHVCGGYAAVGFE